MSLKWDDKGEKRTTWRTESFLNVKVYSRKTYKAFTEYSWEYESLQVFYVVFKLKRKLSSLPFNCHSSRTLPEHFFWEITFPRKEWSFQLFWEFQVISVPSKTWKSLKLRSFKRSSATYIDKWKFEDHWTSSKLSVLIFLSAFKCIQVWSDKGTFCRNNGSNHMKTKLWLMTKALDATRIMMVSKHHQPTKACLWIANCDVTKDSLLSIQFTFKLPRSKRD